MDTTHLHLLLNHAPLMGAYFALGLILLGLFIRRANLERVGLGLMVLCALLVIPVYLTGEPAEDRVEGLPGVTETVVEEHEESALPTLIAFEVAGVVALAGLILYRRSPEMPRPFTIATLLLTLAVTGLIARTANLGGQIRHTEIRAASSLPSGSSEQGEHEERE